MKKNKRPGRPAIAARLDRVRAGIAGVGIFTSDKAARPAIEKIMEDLWRVMKQVSPSYTRTR